MHAKANTDLVRVSVLMVHYREIKVTCFAVFMSPECALKPPWRNIFTTPHGKANIVLVAVDEAHCIEDWSVISW